VREVGRANKGLWVSFFQQYTGNAAGDSWCCSFICWLLAIYYQGKSPFTKTASCQTLLDQCRQLGSGAAGKPAAGDLFFYLDATGHAHHVGGHVRGGSEACSVSSASPATRARTARATMVTGWLSMG
jgi:hypothetical protein